MNSLRTILILTIALLASACALMNESEYHIYEGEERPVEDLLIVKVPEHLEVLNVNGKTLTKGGSKLFGSSKHTLYMLPGEYTIDAFYKEIWDNHVGSHNVIRSQPAMFIVRGEAGEEVSLEFDKPERQEDAEEFAKEFKGWSVNANTGDKIPTKETSTQRPSILASMQDQNQKPEEAESVAPMESQSSSQSQDLLPKLKAFWKQANEEEKREFLMWISE